MDDLKNNKAPLLCCFKFCASFHRHMWIQTRVTVRKRLNGVMTSVTLTFDLWPWPLAWTSLLLMVITPENFMMMRWQEHCEKGVTDIQTYRRTKRGVLRVAWSQLKPARCNYSSLQWRHNEIAGVSNHQPHDCLLSRLFTRISKKTSKHRVTGFCVGNSPVAGDFPAQRASNAENLSIWWRHHALTDFSDGLVLMLRHGWKL